jgi:dTDP-glucose 4,6-dehydratase/UDP-glucose 4-epimerase
MTFARSRVLITGGLGFIGSNLARRLVSEGADVTVVDSLDPRFGGNRFNIEDIKSKLTVEIADIRDEAAMRRLISGKDYLFNLAAQTSHVDSMNDPRADLEINTAGQVAILEACRADNAGIKIVLTSTRQFYGKPDYLPVDEKHPIRPPDVNGINKLAGEQYHLLYHRVYGMRTCALRLTNTYGPRMRAKDARQTFVGIWIRQIVEGNPITVFGDGEQRRDLNYVDDCVEALLAAASSDVADGKAYNLGSDEVVTLKELAGMMAGLKKGGSYELLPFPAERKAIDIGDYYGDFSLIKRELGWQPKTSLLRGLQQTVEFYEKHFRHYWE